MSLLCALVAIAIKQPVQLCWNPEDIAGSSAAYEIPAGQTLDAGVRDASDGRIFLLLHRSKPEERRLVAIVDGHEAAVDLPNATSISLPYLRSGKVCLAIVGERSVIVEYGITDDLKLVADGRKYKDPDALSHELAPGIPKVPISFSRRWPESYFNTQNWGLSAPVFPGPPAYADSDGGIWCFWDLTVMFLKKIDQPRDQDISAEVAAPGNPLSYYEPVATIYHSPVLYETIRARNEPNTFFLVRATHSETMVSAATLKVPNVFLVPAISNY